MGVCASGHFLGRAAGDQFPPLMSPFRAQVDDVVGRFDHIEIVFDDDDGMTFFDQQVQALKQPIDVGKVKPGRRLVENI